MSEILEKNKLNFGSKTLHDMKLAICKRTNPDCYPLSNFLCECYWSSMAESAINKLENIFKQPSKEDEFQTRAIIIVSNISDTEFVEDGNPQSFNNPNLTIPTVDFRDILIEWKKFLKEIGV